MTNEQAIRALHYVRESFALDVDSYEALNMAIEALSCSEKPNDSDLISRQAAIDALKEHRAGR